MKLLKSFISTVGFLTIIPTPKKYSQELGHSIIFFPIAAVVIGGLLAAVNVSGSFFFPKQVVSLLIVSAFVIITGGLHLDGLADTADGFYAGKNKEDILRIMDDSRTGAMGVVAIALAVLSKFVLMNSIPENILNLSLIAVPAAGKLSAVLSLKFARPAKEDGLGNTFSKNATAADFILSVSFTLLIFIFLLGLKGLMIPAAVIFISFIFSKYSEKKIGGVTGDTLGAINEISEIIALLILCVKHR